MLCLKIFIDKVQNPSTSSTLQCVWCPLWELIQFGVCLLINRWEGILGKGILKEKQEHIWINKEPTKHREGSQSSTKCLP